MREDNKRVGVLTFHDYDNYGAALQSFALQKTLLEAGYEAEIIDYSCPYIHDVFTLRCLKNKGLANYLYGVIGHICYMPRRRRFADFRKRIRYSDPVKREELDARAEAYDCVITGSDQLWDVALTDFDRSYFLDFVTPPVRRISYAVSMGEHEPPEEYHEEIRRLLLSFDRILMREEYGAEWVEAHTGLHPDVACDPTLLLDVAQWSAVADEDEKTRATGKRKKPYILVYQLGISPQMVRFVGHLAASTGLRVQYVPFPLVGLLRCGLHLAAGPTDWISLIRDAEYVVSDSFHGIVFALLFHRKFYAQVDGHHMNRRLQELLAFTGLSDREVHGGTLPESVGKEMDFSGCDRALEGLRRKSLSLLLDALEARA